MARKIYNGIPEKEREAKKKELAKILSASERTVRNWLSGIDKDTKTKRNKRIVHAWMSCHTHGEISEKEGISVQPVTDAISDFVENMPENLKLLANHKTDFTQPLYNVWKFKNKTNQVTHFGNSEITIVDNLLAKYAKAFDVVVDPFAASTFLATTT